MLFGRFSFFFRHYWSNDRINYSIKVLLALIGVTVPCAYYDLSTLVIPLVLGIIAAALAETDDNLKGRIKALIMTLICFVIASLSIELLFDHPLFFTIGLFSSTFIFIMLGALGTRYASIAFASLLLAIYTMLGAKTSPNLWHQPLLLLLGASWYGLISLLWHILWPNQAVQQSLSQVFQALGDYLTEKSQLFDPVPNLQSQTLRVKAAQQNAKVVTRLNQAKLTLLHRARRGHPNPTNEQFLKLYFMAQDIHERVSSSHYRYKALAQSFQRSDVLFRFERVLQTHANACQTLAQTLLMEKPYQHSEKSQWDLDQLQHALLYLKEQEYSEWRDHLLQLDYLFQNLSMVEHQLSHIYHSDAQPINDDNELAESEIRSVREGYQRIVNQLNLKSLLFRHAIRMATALTLGYACLSFLHLDRGYWILLTTLFVCQPNYYATKEKMTQRVLGTLSGILLGIPLLYWFPGTEGQLVLMVIAGVCFFAFRTIKYGVATACITLLVLFCFSQLGQGFDVILPRILDTLIGCALAVFAVMFIFPDWQSQRLPQAIRTAFIGNQAYLGQIIGQYRFGKHDNLPYRIARRNAHNGDAQLTMTIHGMLAEPERYAKSSDDCFRLLTLNHAMLSYISALGAHRHQLDNDQHYALITQAHRRIHHDLDLLSQPNSQNQPQLDVDLERTLRQWHEEDRASVRMILQQLYLIQRMLPEMGILMERISEETTKMPDVNVKAPQ